MSDAAQPTRMLRLEMTAMDPDNPAQKYGKLKAAVRAMRESARYDDPPDTWLWSHESLYADLVMSTYYGDPDINSGHAYGPLEIGYESGALVTQQEAARFHKGLSKVIGAYTKLGKACGRPQSTGHEVAYYMAVMGIKSACVRLPADQPGLSFHHYRILTSPESVRDYIDRTMAAFLQHRLAQPVAA
jgi:hypothetical protein